MQACLLVGRPDRGRAQVARRNKIVSGARARNIPVFHVDIRLYAIGSTDRRR